MMVICKVGLGGQIEEGIIGGRWVWIGIFMMIIKYNVIPIRYGLSYRVISEYKSYGLNLSRPNHSRNNKAETHPCKKKNIFLEMKQKAE